MRTPRCSRASHMCSFLFLFFSLEGEVRKVQVGGQEPVALSHQPGGAGIRAQLLPLPPFFPCLSPPMHASSIERTTGSFAEYFVMPFASDAASARAAGFFGRTLSLMWRLLEPDRTLDALDESTTISKSALNGAFIWLDFPEVDINLHPALEMVPSSHPYCTKSATVIPCIPE